MRSGTPFMQVAGLAVLAFLLGACAALSQDGGVDAVRTLTRERIGANVALPAKGTDSKTSLAAAREILAKPLTVDDVVQLALLNNPGLRASFAELGGCRGRPRSSRAPAQSAILVQQPEEQRHYVD